MDFVLVASVTLLLSTIVYIIYRLIRYYMVTQRLRMLYDYRMQALALDARDEPADTMADVIREITTVLRESRR